MTRTKQALATALSIAGSDPSGGAGIQADLKTFHHFDVYGSCVLTLLTAQNTRGVFDVQLISEALIDAQLDAVLSDIGANAAKTGALGSAGIIELVSARFARARDIALVVDPVMISKHGDPLLGDDAISILRNTLIPLATVVTPNRHEASALCGFEINTIEHMKDAAKALADLGARAIVVKGGSSPSMPDARDILLCDGVLTELPSAKIDTPHTHGSGCTYSAAITAELAKNRTIVEAVSNAKVFMTQAIRGAPGLGHGRGPVDHWAKR